MNDEIIDELAIVGFGSHSVKSYFNMPSINFSAAHSLLFLFIVEQNEKLNLKNYWTKYEKGKKRPHLLNELPWT